MTPTHQNNSAPMNARRNKPLFITVLYGCLLLLASCTTTGQEKTAPAELQALREAASMPGQTYPQHRPAPQGISEAPLSQTAISPPLQPKFKEISPLDTEFITISFTEEGYRQIFHLLAKSAGLNLVLDPELESLVGGYRLTAEYLENPVRSVLDATCSMLNITWREEHSTLFIEPYIAETIHLDFIVSTNQSSFSVGGDVLGSSSGSSDESITAPLTGRFEIGGTIADNVTDIYTNVEETVGRLVGEEGRFVLNRQTGTLLVRARPRVVKEVRQYLDDLRHKYAKQVLIEARIIEVNLNESRQLGIDWQNLSVLASTEPIQALGQTIVGVTAEASGGDSFFNFTIDNDKMSIDGVFRALEEYGTLKILSNPRLKAMNGQSAVISVGQSVSYLRSLTRTVEGTGDSRSEEITSEIGAIFDGILLGVTPVIRNDNSVSLHIVPIKSELVALDQQQLGSGDALRITFPTVNLREISTIVNVKPGNIVVLGGLIMEKEQDVEVGLPYLGKLPLVGFLFKEQQTQKQKVEMIVVLKLNVLE